MLRSSRSYKKHPYIKEGYKSPDKRKRKQRANKRVRTEEVADNGAYRKVFNPWNICDWRFELPKTKKGLSK